MIRAATPEDFPAIEKHGEAFWDLSYIDIPYRAGSALPYIELCFSHGLLLVAETDGEVIGFAAGVKAPLMGDSNVIQGSEIAWWVDPAHRKGGIGIRLLKALEQAARDAGCTFWNMVYMEVSMPETVRDMYIKLGYRLNETTYGKRL